MTVMTDLYLAPSEPVIFDLRLRVTGPTGVVSVSYTRTASATLSAITDLATKAFSTRRTSSDQVPILVDNAARIAAYLRQIGDSNGALVDAAARVVAFRRVSVDSIQFYDLPIAVTSFKRSVADAVAMADVASRRVAASRNAAEILSQILDTATRQVATSRRASEALTQTDSATRQVASSRATSDSTLIHAQATRQVAANRRTAEVLSLSDLTQRQVAINRLQHEALMQEAAAVRQVTVSRLQSQELTDVESNTERQVDLHRFTTSDVLAAEETTQRQASVSRIPTETLEQEDTALRLVTATRSVGELQDLTASAVRQVDANRRTQEVIRLTDRITRQIDYARLGEEDVAFEATVRRKVIFRPWAYDEMPEPAASLDRHATYLRRPVEPLPRPRDTALRELGLTRTTSDQVGMIAVTAARRVLYVRGLEEEVAEPLDSLVGLTSHTRVTFLLEEVVAPEVTTTREVAFHRRVRAPLGKITDASTRFLVLSRTAQETSRPPVARSIRVITVSKSVSDTMSEAYAVAARSVRYPRRVAAQIQMGASTERQVIVNRAAIETVRLLEVARRVVAVGRRAFEGLPEPEIGLQDRLTVFRRASDSVAELNLVAARTVAFARLIQDAVPVDAVAFRVIEVSRTSETNVSRIVIALRVQRPGREQIVRLYIQATGAADVLLETVEVT